MFDTSYHSHPYTYHSPHRFNASELYISSVISDINEHTIYFGEQKQNIVVNGFFTKILLSKHFATLNNILLQIPFPLFQIPGKHTYCIQKHQREVMAAICDLESVEQMILSIYSSYFKCDHKRPVAAISNYFHADQIKVYKHNGFDKQTATNNMAYIVCYLKISGVWETTTEYGINFKVHEGGFAATTESSCAQNAPLTPVGTFGSSCASR